MKQLSVMIVIFFLWGFVGAQASDASSSSPVATFMELCQKDMDAALCEGLDQVLRRNHLLSAAYLMVTQKESRLKDIDFQNVFFARVHFLPAENAKVGLVFRPQLAFRLKDQEDFVWGLGNRLINLTPPTSFNFNSQLITSTFNQKPVVFQMSDKESEEIQALSVEYVHLIFDYYLKECIAFKVGNPETPEMVDAYFVKTQKAPHGFKFYSAEDLPEDFDQNTCISSDI